MDNYMDMQKEIDKVLKQFRTELKASRVVDKDDNVTDKKAFAKLIDHAIDRLNDLKRYVEDEAGVTIDRYSNNILRSNIQILEDMKQNSSLDPDADKESIRRGLESEEERFAKESLLRVGINKIKELFGKRKASRQANRDSR